MAPILQSFHRNLQTFQPSRRKWMGQCIKQKVRSAEGTCECDTNQENFELTNTLCMCDESLCVGAKQLHKLPQVPALKAYHQQQVMQGLHAAPQYIHTQSLIPSRNSICLGENGTSLEDLGSSISTPDGVCDHRQALPFKLTLEVWWNEEILDFLHPAGWTPLFLPFYSIMGANIFDSWPTLLIRASFAFALSSRKCMAVLVSVRSWCRRVMDTLLLWSYSKAWQGREIPLVWVQYLCYQTNYTVTTWVVDLHVNHPAKYSQGPL